MKNIYTAFLLAVAAIAACAGSAPAKTSYTSGNGYFRLDIYGKGESFSSAYLQENTPAMQHSLHDLPAWQEERLRYAVDFWDSLLSLSRAPASPAILATITDNDDNAGASGVPMTVSMQGKPTIYRSANCVISLGKKPEDTISGAIELGTKLLPADMLQESYKTPLPQNSQISLSATMIHEIGHAMGITTDSGQEAKDSIFQFDEDRSIFDSHLYDWRGQPSQPSMQIQTAGHKATKATYFDLPGYYGEEGMKLPYFSGPHVQEVLNGTRITVYNTYGKKTGQYVPGLPINGNEAQDADEKDDADLAHIELRNSMMSHQQWRNYLSFMEAELALLQDIGYTIDRRNFFGRSIYGDNGSIVNTSPFFARNADGTAYVPNTYNMSTHGIGLHIYGNGNRVEQQAPLLTKGVAGVGIRIDGTGNSVIVGSGTRVHADGLNGHGILTAFGKNHTISIAPGASVRAMGEGGIGAAFDFGTNLLGIIGDNSYERASWATRTGYSADKAAEVEVDGPLVEEFSVSGELAGKKAAIYIDDSAYVKNIRIGSGASISGPIISDWAYSDRQLEKSKGSLYGWAMRRQYGGNDELTTRISFEGTGLSYGGDISGQENMRMAVSGSLAYSGTAKVLSVEVEKGGILSGGTYRLQTPDSSEHTMAYAMGGRQRTLNNVGLLINHGAFGAGSASSPATVQGDLQSSGILFARADTGRHAGIAVSGTARVDGSKAIALNALPGETYTALSASSIAGTTSNDKSSPFPVSGMLSQHSWKEGNTVLVGSEIENNTCGTPGYAFDAAAYLFAQQPVGSAWREAMRPLLNLSPAGARSALDGLVSNAAVRSISLLQQGQLAPHILSARMHDVLGIDEGPENPATHFWLKSGGRWGRQDSTAHYRGKFAVAGWDHALAGNWRAGAFAGYEENDFSPNHADADLRSARLGLYAWRHGERSDALLYAGLTQTEHHLRRSLPLFGLRTDARYHSTMAEAGGEWKLTLAEKNGWRAAPYAGAHYSRIWQEAFTESGGDIFSQNVEASAYDYLSGSAGMEVSLSLKQGGIALRAGGRHVFAGAEPRLRFSLDRYRDRSWLMEARQDKNFFTLSIDGGIHLPSSWELTGSAGMERGGHSSHLRCTLLLLKKW
ncbi:MAG: autotransporter domain-containing protein [Mailhella sp.]|nr:autotransporter domain-containing protein [Mailhella sp.]